MDATLGGWRLWVDANVEIGGAGAGAALPGVGRMQWVELFLYLVAYGGVAFDDIGGDEGALALWVDGEDGGLGGAGEALEGGAGKGDVEGAYVDEDEVEGVVDDGYGADAAGTGDGGGGLGGWLVFGPGAAGGKEEGQDGEGGKG